jgi:hypothetical protein
VDTGVQFAQFIVDCQAMPGRIGPNNPRQIMIGKLYHRAFMLGLCGIVGVLLSAENSAHGVGVPDVPESRIVTPQQFGAKADGVADDTEAIQKAINTVFDRGGGVVFFPRGVYVLGKPPVTRDFHGDNPNSQIYIPSRAPARLKADGSGLANPGEHDRQGGISLVGECVPLSTVGQYAVHQVDPEQIRLVTNLPAPFAGSVIYSTYVNARPEGIAPSILGFSVPGSAAFGFASGQTEIKNLTFRARVEQGKGYPTLSGVNAQCARSMVMANVNVDVDLPLPQLKESPADVAGILMPKVNCELSYCVNLGVYGFKYGYIFGEHSNGDAIYAATCTHAFAFSGGSHLICLGLLTAQNCKYQVSSLSSNVLGHPPGRAYIKIQGMDIERNPGQIPFDFNYTNVVNDPGNQLCGSLTYQIVTSRVGADNASFVKSGGAHLQCQPSFSE